MPITEKDKELFLAILSMDSYNRGYGQKSMGQRLLMMLVDPVVLKMGAVPLRADAEMDDQVTV